MDAATAQELIAMIGTLVDSRDDLRALAVCGSWARGNPRPDSDLDLLVIARDAATWRDETQWVSRLPYERARLSYRSHVIATYGVVWSVHVSLEPSAQLELTVASPDWASCDPVDGGTRDVVLDAFKVVVDKDGCLARLVAACAPRA